MKTKLIARWNDLVARVLGYANTGRTGIMIRNSRYVKNWLQIPMKVTPEEMTYLYGGYGPEGWTPECESAACVIERRHQAVCKRMNYTV